MKIKELRAITGMSQREFADHFGISVRSLQQWEQERSQPPDYLVGLLQRILKSEETNGKWKPTDADRKLVMEYMEEREDNRNG